MSADRAHARSLRKSQQHTQPLPQHASMLGTPLLPVSTNQVIRDVVIHMQEKSTSLVSVLSRMPLTLHATRQTPHGASRLVLATSAWSVKTRRAPSRHCRDARVYGHTTTACINMSTTPSASTRRSAQNLKRPRPPHRATRKMTAHPPLSLNELPSRFCGQRREYDKKKTHTHSL